MADRRRHDSGDVEPNRVIDVVPGSGAHPRPAVDENVPHPDGANALIAAVVVAGVVVVGAAVVVFGGQDDAPPVGDEPSATASSELPVANTLEGVRALDGSTVGTIVWDHVDGVERMLPEFVALDANGDVVGGDDSGRRWELGTDGRWRSHEETVREVGGIAWRLAGREASLTLAVEMPTGWEETDLAGSSQAVPDGLVAETVPALDPSDGFPIVLGNELFLLASRRVELPWREFVDVVDDGSYRVRLTDGDRAIRAAQGDYRGLGVEEFRLSPAPRPGGFDVVDADGATVWSFDAHPGRGPLEAAAGSVDLVWLGWNGQDFAPVARPWQLDDRVELVRFGGGVLARVADADDDVRLWRSADGRRWSELELPAARTAGTPVGLHGSYPDARLTIHTGGRHAAFSTADGERFVEMPNVPGVVSASRADFGWVAADPRSSPLLRVSRDFDAWETVELDDLLGLDASRWDVRLTAVGRRDTIYVIADRPSGPTMLVGTVLADQATDPAVSLGLP